MPLDHHEVVLTFDDGPWPATTSKVLAALAQECVRATFFLIGRPASEHPAWCEAIAARGPHYRAPHLDPSAISNTLKPDARQRRDRQGHSGGRDGAAGDSDHPRHAVFRFPYFEATPQLLERLQKRGIVVFGADLWASDWNKMTPQQELKLITGRLAADRKGIILFHDPKAQTAAMLPAFLRYLRDNHYRVVHVVPAGPKTVSDKAQ